MSALVRAVAREPLYVIAVLWPLAVLAATVPRLLALNQSLLPWRQELALGVLLCLTLALCVRRVRAARPIGVNRGELGLTITLALFVLWSAVSTAWAQSPFAAFHYVLTWCAYLLFFVLMCRVARRARLLRLSLAGLTLLTLYNGLSSVVDFWRGLHVSQRYNGLGEPLAVCVPFFVALALSLRRTRASVLCGATAALAWLATLQAGERAPFIGAMAGLLSLFAIWVAAPRFRPRSLRRTLLLFTALAFVTALQEAAPSALRMNRPAVTERLQATNMADPNVGVRLRSWAVAAEMLRARPLSGAGAGNFEVSFPDALARFSARHPDSRLVGLYDDYLVRKAHNEYLQIAAELGLVGCVLFAGFCVLLAACAVRALRRGRSRLVPGAVCSLLAFAVSSSASSVSFRYFGSGLLAFLFAALLAGAGEADRERAAVNITPAARWTLLAAALVCTLVLCGGMFAQGMNALYQALAVWDVASGRRGSYYVAALRWNPYDATTHFNYGVWLYDLARAEEAAPHLRYATRHGLNAPRNYGVLASAELNAHDPAAAERTLVYAIGVYPRSVFLRVLHSNMLAQAGRAAESAEEYGLALRLNGRVARGWWNLINLGPAAAEREAREHADVAAPADLRPEFK